MGEATFGKTDNGASYDTISVDMKVASRAQCESAGFLLSLTARLWVESTSTPGRAVIYSDAGGVPDALLAVSDEETIDNTSEDAITFTFSGANQIALEAEAWYWLGVHLQDPGTPYWYVSRGVSSNQGYRLGDTYSDGPSDPWGSLYSRDGPYDCYATYQEAGGVPWHVFNTRSAILGGGLT